MMQLHLFAANTMDHADIDRGWHSIVGDGLHVHLVGGDHFSIMKDPLIESIAKTMNQTLWILQN